MRALSIGITVVFVLATITAAAPPPQRVSTPAPPKPQPTTAATSIPLPPPGMVQLDPSRLDFAPLWSGESAHKTAVFTVPNAGTVSATPPPAPFSIVAMRVFSGQPTTGGKGVAGPGTGTTPTAANNVVQRTSPPWEVSCAAGNQVQIEVAFAPVFDLFKMAAGEKSATIQLRGPSRSGSWNAALPVAGMFNGVKLVPLMQVLDADRAVRVTSSGQASLTIRFVSTGQPFNATVKELETSRYSLRGSQFNVTVPAGGTVDLAMWMVIKPSPCCAVESTAATIEAAYTQGATKGTLSAPIHWTLVPDPFTWTHFSGGCRGVSFGGTLTLDSSGAVSFNGQLWSIYTERQTEMLQLTFSGVSRPVWGGELTALPLPGEKTGGGGHLDLGPASSDASPAFLHAVKTTPVLGCGK